MKKISKNPTSFACDVLSFIVPASGIGVAAAYLAGGPRNWGSIGIGLLIILGGFVIAVVIRVLGIIGQNLFDLNAKVMELRFSMDDKMDKTNQDLNKFNQDFDRFSQDFNRSNRVFSKDVDNLRKIVDQINCDTKDFNESLRQIKFFFDQIEKHLQLKK